jgi:hypothetical protein
MQKQYSKFVKFHNNIEYADKAFKITHIMCRLGRLLRN